MVGDMLLNQPAQKKHNNSKRYEKFLTNRTNTFLSQCLVFGIFFYIECANSTPIGPRQILSNVKKVLFTQAKLV